MISIIDENGVERFLGAKLDEPLKMKWGVYGDVPQTPMVPESKWLDYFEKDDTTGDDPYLSPVHDQDGVGQCACEALTEGVEDIRSAKGLDYVQLSPADLYARVNGGRDQGSTLEDGMHEAMTRGLGTAATSGLLWKRGYKAAPADERARFRVLQAWLCPEFEHIISAILCGFRVITGKPWYSNYNVDADGWLPTSGRGSAGGHSTLAYRPAWRSGKFGVWERQSWGAWGYKKLGRFATPREAFRSAGGNQHWAIRDVVMERSDAPTPKFTT